jgi:phosphotransferase system enzyme I (PtsP)
MPARPPADPPRGGTAQAAGPRRLLARLRHLMAHGDVPLAEVTSLVAAELVSEVCSLYVRRPGDILELKATEGLNRDAVGRTRLRVGEGLVGLVAATGKPLNLPDAQNHPAFAYRPETAEEPYTSMVAVPVRRAGRTLGVLAVQSRAIRRFDPDEVEVLETVAMLLAEALAARLPDGAAEEGFVAAVPRRFDATALAPGAVIGPVLRRGPLRAPARLLADDPDTERVRLADAVAAMQRGLDALIDGGLPPGDAPREILDAHRLIAADAGWLRRVQETIQSGLSAEAAVHRVAAELRGRMRGIADPYLRERLADVEDLIGRLLRALDGEAADAPPAQGAILVARRLGPAELLDWHARGIAGIAVEEASEAGHAAILARALGLPALGAVRGLLDVAADGDEALLDAEEALFVLRPEEELKQAYAREAAVRADRQARWAALRTRPSETADGTEVTLMLNVGLPLELAQLDATGSAGIGLFRTEIAMLARGAIADLAEQQAVYARVLAAASGRPVVFRTLDLGGDKLLPGTTPSEEANPAMGWRSLRVGLDRPAVLRRQLRALLLAADGGPLSIMFPMVATVAEFAAARALLHAEAARVPRQPERLAVGTMLEIPALMWQLDELLAEADFISVGTNDLMQFMFAADRGAPALAGRYDILSPAMLTLLDHLRARAAAAVVPLSICGEAAGRPLEAVTFAGLGITTLSMPAVGLMPVKEALATIDLAAFRAMLASIRRTDAAAPSLRDLIAGWAREHGVPV